MAREEGGGLRSHGREGGEEERALLEKVKGKGMREIALVFVFFFRPPPLRLLLRGRRSTKLTRRNGIIHFIPFPRPHPLLRARNESGARARAEIRFWGLDIALDTL